YTKRIFCFVYFVCFVVHSRLLGPTPLRFDGIFGLSCAGKCAIYAATRFQLDDCFTTSYSTFCTYPRRRNNYPYLLRNYQQDQYRKRKLERGGQLESEPSARQW